VWQFTGHSLLVSTVPTNSQDWVVQELSLLYSPFQTSEIIVHNSSPYAVLTVSFTKFHSCGHQDVDNSTLFRFGHFCVCEMHSDHLQLLWSTYLLNSLYSNNNLLVTFRIVLRRDGQIFSDMWLHLPSSLVTTQCYQGLKDMQLNIQNQVLNIFCILQYAHPCIFLKGIFILWNFSLAGVCVVQCSGPGIWNQM